MGAYDADNRSASCFWKVARLLLLLFPVLYSGILPSSRRTASRSTSITSPRPPFPPPVALGQPPAEVEGAARGSLATTPTWRTGGRQGQRRT